jgi:uncharacterized protein (TIGR02001 family)
MKQPNTLKILTLATFLMGHVSMFNRSASANEGINDSNVDSGLTANISVVSNYIWRGLTQTDNRPAVQGGIDFAHESGFYLGNWNSNITWVADEGYANNSHFEMNFYAGLKKEWLGSGFASDIGFIKYYYPSSGTNAGFTNPNTGEVYVAQNFTVGRVSGYGKFSYSVTNSQGFSNSIGSSYSELNVDYDTGFASFILNTHIGYQQVQGQYPQAGEASSNYLDWLIGVTKDFGDGFTASLTYVGTNVRKGSGDYANIYAYSNKQGGNAGRNTAFISLNKTF